MSHRKIKRWLLCYDIADPRRLRRIHRYMSGQGWPVQYSVFDLMATPKQLDRIIQTLEEMIDTKQDDIRIYPLHKKPRRVIMGKRLYPEGVMLFDNEIDLLE
jgi:CRISPR-associated protein Cas2